MNTLLKLFNVLPLTPRAYEGFMTRAATLTIIGAITLDDWVYLTHLMVYRATKHPSITAAEKAALLKVLDKMNQQRSGLDGSYTNN